MHTGQAQGPALTTCIENGELIFFTPLSPLPAFQKITTTIVMNMEEQEINLHQFLLIFKRRFPYLIAIFLLIVAVGWEYSSRQAPLYKASNVIIFGPKDQAPVDFGNIDTGKQEEFLETQKQIITSHKVISKVADKLHLKKEDVGKLLASISVESVRNTYMMKINAVHPDPKNTALYANTLAQEYIAYNLETRRDSSDNAFTWLSEQIAVLKVQVRKSELDVLRYQQEENLSSSLEKKQFTVDDQTRELNDTYSKISMQRMEKESILHEIENLGEQWRKLENIPALLENAQINFFKKEYNAIDIALARVATKFKPNHPEVIRLHSQRSLIEKKIFAETKKIANDLKMELRIIQNQEKNVHNRLESLKKESMLLAEQAIQYGVLKREAESNRKMYDVLLERLKETDISGSIVVNNIRILDKARIPEKPFKPNIPRNMLLAGVLGIFIGTGVCFVVEYFDTSFKNEDDLALLNLPLIGTISKNKKINKGNKIGKFNQDYLESKAILDLHRKEHILHTLLITSAVADEGKTTSVASLGMAFAHAGTRVLLVDADMSTSMLSKSFSLEKAAGLSDFFIKQQNADEVIQGTGVENLYLLPSGLTPANSTELLGSNRMKEFIDTLKKDFELIIFDTPAASAHLGVSLLGNLVDGTLLIIKSKSTSSAIVINTLEKLSKLKVNIVGTILTQTKKSTT
ncbi:MAG: polysaccharide biosynthesis tyrosine autokinase [Candidatus Electrothrix sp. AR3]|nr:polysaccharide biosynthesis tyrosine autokinase [Candidatus Electrothrix sp. AR3]